MFETDRWPFIISNPHCGDVIPEFVREDVLLTRQQIDKDSDEQALQIYSPLQSRSQYYCEATAARAFVDLNRKADDFSKDGVVKTHTCWNEPVYRRQLSQAKIRFLLVTYYESYHARLLEAAMSNRFSWLIDCHTMAEYPPPIAPDQNDKRPLVCLGNGHEEGCTKAVFDKVFGIFNEVFNGQVTQNQPFSGGYICRHYGRYLPSLQIELSRTADISIVDKSSRIQLALTRMAQL